ncbi:MAG: ABC transporter ATP-binding protein [Proteobacteria bacterium]|nr:ABC transporter ATP-binding protein [Pseudomonadota bacterium]
MSNSALTLSGIHKYYYKGTPKEILVLRDVNLSIEKGEVVALVAPSGAGKSTMLHIAGLIETADLGQVSLSGKDITGQSDAVRTKVRRNQLGFVYQFHHLLPEFSALENVVLPQLVSGKSSAAAIQRAKKLLCKVGLEERMTHRPGTLSGLKWPRVAFCRALANEPDLLLADEPTGNLDSVTAENVFKTLIELARETGLSAIVATHNLELAARMDRIVKLENGQIVN